MKKIKTVLVLVLGMLLLAACGQKYEALPINEEVDICAICKMQIKDEAFATQLTTKDGKNYKFDDIGCMNEWKKQNGTENIGMDYVRDYNDKEWIEFNKATYVYDDSIRTPMAYGIVNFKDTKSAETFITEQGVGKIMKAEDLAAHDWKQNKNMMEMMDGEGHMSEDKDKDKDKDKDMDSHSKMTEDSSHK